MFNEKENDMYDEWAINSYSWALKLFLSSYSKAKGEKLCIPNFPWINSSCNSSLESLHTEH